MQESTRREKYSDNLNVKMLKTDYETFRLTTQTHLRRRMLQFLAHNLISMLHIGQY